MLPTDQPNSELYANLSELAHGTFPKRCRNCGATYETVDDFVRATLNINPHRSGLKQGFDDDGQAIIELFRNCSCGSTLMDVFKSRRDMTTEGVKRRLLFDQMAERLVEKGIQATEARTAILKWLCEQDSDLAKMLGIHQ